MHDIQKTVAEVLAGVVGTIRSGANDGCSINVINEAQVGDYFARCELDVRAGGRVIEADGIAEAAAAARSYACSVDGGDTDVNAADSMSIARATAHAPAEAVAQADVFCEANGGDNTRACGLAQSDVEAVARAQAEAFAQGFASAETCGCNVSNYAGTHVFEEIWVEAAASAYAKTCASAPLLCCFLHHGGMIAVHTPPRQGCNANFVTDEWMRPSTQNSHTMKLPNHGQHLASCSCTHLPFHTPSDTAAYSAVGVDTTFVTDFGFAIEERMLSATASAITSAISRASFHSDGCSIEIEVCGKTSQCARNNRACRGSGISGTLPCCNSDYHCVRRSDEESRCRRISSPIPSFYEGTVEAPTTCRLPAADAAADED